jgi:hypothetical protein
MVKADFNLETKERFVRREPKRSTIWIKQQSPNFCGFTVSEVPCICCSFQYHGTQKLPY